jgi:hypothetical protein
VDPVVASSKQTSLNRTARPIRLCTVRRSMDEHGHGCRIGQPPDLGIGTAGLFVAGEACPDRKRDRSRVPPRRRASSGCHKSKARIDGPSRP